MGNQSPLGTKPLWNTPGVHLPGPFRSLVRHLRANGVEGDHAYAAAWSQARKWAAKGNARWVKVVAQLEAARAKAKATPNRGSRDMARGDKPAGRHDLVFFTKRSTPKVLTRGAELGDYPDGYGQVVKRRPATADEEKRIARGDWLRVDSSGRGPNDDGYKRTRYRPQLVKSGGRSHGVSAARPPLHASREVLMAAPTKNSPPAAGGKNTAGGAGKGNGGPPQKPGGGREIKSVADVRAAVASIKKLPEALRPKALDRVRGAARKIGPEALKYVPGSSSSGSGGGKGSS